MKVIDILNKKANEEEGHFTFYVKCSFYANGRNMINWEYKNGEITSKDDERFLYYVYHDVYKLNDDIVVIKCISDEETERQIIEDIKEKLYTQCKLKPDEALILKNYIERVEAINDIYEGDKHE